MSVQLEPDGTVRLPIEACRALGWAPGDELELATEGEELHLRRFRPSAAEVVQQGPAVLVTPAIRRALAEALAADGIDPRQAEEAAASLR